MVERRGRPAGPCKGVNFLQNAYHRSILFQKGSNGSNATLKQLKKVLGGISAPIGIEDDISLLVHFSTSSENLAWPGLGCILTAYLPFRPRAMSIYQLPTKFV
jgi:hypothetical protein